MVKYKVVKRERGREGAKSFRQQEQKVGPVLTYNTAARLYCPLVIALYAQNNAVLMAGPGPAGHHDTTKHILQFDWSDSLASCDVTNLNF